MPPMSAEFDQSEFIDRDYEAARRMPTGTPPAAVPGRPPSREELEGRASEMQKKLTDLRRAQEALERERGQLDEARRRLAEFQNGRAEMLQHLGRGGGLLEKAALDARRNAEQMSRTLESLREALRNVEGIEQDKWTAENYSSELTRALTAIENARMEWNSARLKWPVLDGQADPAAAAPASAAAEWVGQLADLGYGKLWRLGLALTWPLAAAALLAVVAFLLARFL